jgi:excisionase family DNA binding protein
MTDRHDYFTRAEAAKLLGVSTSKIFRLQARLGAIKSGRTGELLFPKNDVENYLASHGYGARSAKGRKPRAIAPGALPSVASNEGRRASLIFKAFQKDANPAQICIDLELSPDELRAWRSRYDALVTPKKPEGSYVAGLRIENRRYKDEDQQVRLVGIILWPEGSKDAEPVDMSSEWVDVDSDEGKAILKGDKKDG